MNRQTIPWRGRIIWDREKNTPLPRQPDHKTDVAFFGPWIGEFGWELMTWQGWCRYQASFFKKVYVSSFHDMGMLYADFATFIPHDYPKRVLDWRDVSEVKCLVPDDVTMQVTPFKKYIVEPQEFIKFGDHDYHSQIYIHARGINKGGKNYDHWERLVEILHQNKVGLISSVGTHADKLVEGTTYLRNTNLEYLADHFNTAKCVIGQSSGVMHFATLCGAPVVAWGDQKTYFNQYLGDRYKTTWNPFQTPVTFLYDAKWQPDPEYVAGAVLDMLYKHKPKEEKGGEMSVPVPNALKDILMKATQSKKFLVTVHWMDPNDTLRHYWITKDFPKNEFWP